VLKTDVMGFNVRSSLNHKQSDRRIRGSEYSIVPCGAVSRVLETLLVVIAGCVQPEVTKCNVP
jgi:hypothetical protein